MCPLTDLPIESQDLATFPLKMVIGTGIAVLQKNAYQERILALINTLELA